MKNETSSIFFLCSGFGLGNSARVSAIIDELKKTMPEREIHILTWGLAIPFFKQHPRLKNINIFSLRPYTLPEKFRNLNYISTMLVMGLLSPIKYCKNSFAIYRYFKKIRPGVVVFDSDYHFFPFYFGKRPVMLSINQSFNVLANFFHFGFVKKMETLPSFLVELMDGLAQIIFVDRIIVPTIGERRRSLFRKIFFSPLIVRDVFLGQGFESPSMAKAICLGGSGLDRERTIGLSEAGGFDLLKADPGDIHRNIYPSPQILKYGEIVCQGGLSTISEILATGRKILVVPIRNHCEQYSNYYDVEKIKCIKDYSSNPKNFEGARLIANEITECLAEKV